jgi:putative secretion ATPase (PEP-CTERM system associated)
MYERFYNLRERPFALSPDPEYLYPSRVHREALDYLRYGIETHAGFVMVTGEIGSGKTTMLQTVLRGLDNRTIVARIVNTMLEPRELLETIMIDLGLDPAGKSKPVLLRDLAQFLIDQRMAGRLVLIVVDEAQNLSLATLEEIRMLSNLETEKSKLLQIVLVGQPELRDSLASDQLAQLRQRITVSYHLRPLDSDETTEYINHRLRRAALGAPLQIPRDVTNLVFERSGGVPRLINVICDALLVFGYAGEQSVIDLALAREVMAELEMTGVLSAGVPAAAISRPALSASKAPTAVRVAESAAPSPAASIVDAELQAREAQLQAREAALMARERELAEQRRVFTEEYRLMRRSLTTHARPPEPPQVTLARPAGTVEQVLTRVWRALARSPEQPVTDRVSS